MNILILLDKISTKEELVFRYIFEILGTLSNLNFSTTPPKNLNQFDLIINYSLAQKNIQHKALINISKSGSEQDTSDSPITTKKEKNLNQININFDIIKPIIYFLSLEHEKNLEENGTFINSLSKNLHLSDLNRFDKDHFSQPIINQSIFLLKEIMLNLVGSNNTTPIEKPLHPNFAQATICLTHDVDGIKKDAIDRLKHLRHSLVRISTLLRKARLSASFEELFQLFIKLFSFTDYNQFKKIIEIEKEHNISSSFNFFVKTDNNQQSLKERIINPRYDISSDNLKEIFTLLKENNKEIALHGSYESFNNQELLTEEKNKLETTINLKIQGGRQHFLRFSTLSTFEIYEENNMRYDTTYGFRDINGFRASICLPFKPIKNPSQHYKTTELPLIIMDGIFFDRNVKSKDNVWKETLKLLKIIKNNQGCASVVWHNRVFNNLDYPSWSKIYSKLLDWAVSENVHLCSPIDYINWLDQRSNIQLKQRTIKNNKTKYILTTTKSHKTIQLTIPTSKKLNIKSNYKISTHHTQQNIQLEINNTNPEKDILITFS
jgi:hypothetical protein